MGTLIIYICIECVWQSLHYLWPVTGNWGQSHLWLLHHISFVKFFSLISFFFWLSDCYRILHMTQQLCCGGMCKTFMQSDDLGLYYSKMKFELWMKSHKWNRPLSQKSSIVIVLLGMQTAYFLCLILNLLPMMWSITTDNDGKSLKPGQNIYYFKGNFFSVVTLCMECYALDDLIHVIRI